MEPDKDFKRSLPDDCKYKIGKIVVKRKKGILWNTEGSFGASKTATTPVTDISLLKMGWLDPSNGESVSFEIEKIERINFEGKAIQQEFPMRELSVRGDVNK